MPRLHRSRSLCTLTFVLFLPLAAQQPATKVPPDRGYLQGGAYHNVLFSFAYRYPEGWEASTVDDLDGAAVAQSTAKDEASAKLLKQGADARIPLFVVKKTGTAESVRAHVMDLYFIPNLQSPEEFLDAAELSVSSMTSMKLERIGSEAKEIAGHKIVSRRYRSSYRETAIFQTMVAFIDQKYLVNFVATFATEGDLAKYDIASALTFSPKAVAKEAPKETKPREPRPDDAEVVGGTYRNTFFHLTMTVPESWEIQDAESIQRLKAAGERGMKKEPQDPERAEAEEAAAQEIRYLITAMPKAKGAVLMSFCQDLLLAPEVASAEQYLNLMAQSMPGGGWKGPLQETTIQGRKFTRGEYLQKVGDVEVTHLLFATMERKFALVFDVIAADPKLREQGLKIIETAVFAPSTAPAKKP
jgi:hypothetical protein